jgi:predicted HTH domain antitoxin
MSLQLDIPDSVTQALRLPHAEQQQRLTTELALSLYAQSILSFGKAREMARLGKYEFGVLLGQRGISRRYELDDLQDDVTYARGQ